MKKMILCLMLLGLLIQLKPAFAGEYPSGGIYENTVIPVATGMAKSFDKIGTAECSNILKIVQVGQCGIQDAMKNGGLKSIHHVDLHREGTFIVKKLTTTVYGE